MSKNLPTTLPVKKVEQENHRTVTLTFETYPVFNSETTQTRENQLDRISPGQFVMLWLPGASEKPISVGYADKKIIQLTVSAVGPWSKEIQKVRAGSKLGIRGPYGNTFKLLKEKGLGDSSKKILMVGGGFGVAPLHFLSHTAKQRGIKIDFIIGARNKKELLYLNRIKKVANLHITTDDGSVGTRGFTTDKLSELLKQNKYSCIYSCGPEIMMKRVAELARNFEVPSQLSLERYMKCGFGICGSCCLDDSGKRICIDGTIFSGSTALREKGFGGSHRDSCGKKV